MAARFGGKAGIEDIDLEIEGARVGYEIEFRREGRNLEVQFAPDGTIAETNGPAVAPVGATLINPAATAAAPSVPVKPSQSIEPAQPSGGVPTLQSVQSVPEVRAVQRVQPVHGVRPVLGVHSVQPVQSIPAVRQVRPVQPVRSL